MADVVAPAVRSRMMSGIKGTNTRPELLLRKGLHAKGLRFRLHDKRLPGKPDLVFPSRRAVLFAHGCFWHVHDCHLFKWPATRAEFWKEKLTGNVVRDQRDLDALHDLGWRAGIVWECALKGRTRLSEEVVIARCAAWLRSDEEHLEVEGSAGR